MVSQTTENEDTAQVDLSISDCSYHFPVVGRRLFTCCHIAPENTLRRRLLYASRNGLSLTAIILAAIPHPYTDMECPAIWA
jgi:hypothetical protein